MTAVSTGKTAGSSIEEKPGSQALSSEEYTVKAMPKVLGSLNMTSLYLVAIFFIVNAVTAASGGASALTYLALGAVAFFIPCAIATAQLGVLYPNEGSLYNWTHRALGGYWSFFIGFCAWFPGFLVIVAGADIVVSFMQGLNRSWLVEPWQQGVALLAIIAATGLLALLWRTRVLALMANAVVALIFLAVAIIGLAGVVYLMRGHPSQTNFHQLSGWGIRGGNIGLFGLITLAYLGTSVPLNMGAEIRGDTSRVVKRHILWGTLLVLMGYFIATFSVLVVQGSAASSVGGFALVNVVRSVFGQVMGDVTAICIMAFFIMVPVVYNITFARLLLVGGIDQRLPMRVARLNKNRVPASAIIFQSSVAIAFTLMVFFVIPYVVRLGGDPANLSIEVYNISQATATLVWAISSAFFFINLVVFYRRDRAAFRRQRILPMPVLWVCILVGPVACLLAIIDTLFNAWIPQIPNGEWWWIVGGVTLICLVIAGLGVTGSNLWRDASLCASQGFPPQIASRSHLSFFTGSRVGLR